MLRIHAVLPKSSANGPGLRAVVWFQGCTIRCPGCCNPDAQDSEGGTPFYAEDLAAWVLTQKVNGLTLSGGEPLEQTRADLCAFLNIVREADLSIVLFTGRNDVPEDVACYLDAAIVGPYDGALSRQGMRASSNQRLVLYTSLYTKEDFDKVPPVEVFVYPGGKVIRTGVGG